MTGGIMGMGGTLVSTCMGLDATGVGCGVGEPILLYLDWACCDDVGV